MPKLMGYSKRSPTREINGKKTPVSIFLKKERKTSNQQPNIIPQN